MPNRFSGKYRSFDLEENVFKPEKEYMNFQICNHLFHLSVKNFQEKRMMYY